MFRTNGQIENNLLLSKLRDCLYSTQLTNSKISDHLSSAVSLELRMPFMDHLFLETYWSTPCKDWFNDGFNKAYIRQAMARISKCDAFINSNKTPKPGNYDALIDDTDFFSFAMDSLKRKDQRDYLEGVRPFLMDSPGRKLRLRPTINLITRQLFYDIWEEMD